MKIVMKHLRACKICSGGARKWWKQKGFDWNDFLSNGIESDKLLATGDHHAELVVRTAEHGR